MKKRAVKGQAMPKHPSTSVLVSLAGREKTVTSKLTSACRILVNMAVHVAMTSTDMCVTVYLVGLAQCVTPMLMNVLLARVSVAAVLTELLHLRVCASLDIMALTAIKRLTNVLHRLVYTVRATIILTNTAASVTLAGPVTTVTQTLTSATRSPARTVQRVSMAKQATRVNARLASLGTTVKLTLTNAHHRRVSTVCVRMESMVTRVSAIRAGLVKIATNLWTTVRELRAYTASANLFTTTTNAVVTLAGPAPIVTFLLTTVPVTLVCMESVLMERTSTTVSVLLAGRVFTAKSISMSVHRAHV